VIRTTAGAEAPEAPNPRHLLLGAVSPPALRAAGEFYAEVWRLMRAVLTCAGTGQADAEGISR
jgi:hypothetical protein